MVQHVNVENPVDSIVDTSGRPNNEVLWSFTLHTVQKRHGQH